jgi:hypothetical protein
MIRGNSDVPKGSKLLAKTERAKSASTLRTFLCELANIDLRVAEQIGMNRNVLSWTLTLDKARKEGRVGDEGLKPFARFMERYGQMLPSHLLNTTGLGRTQDESMVVLRLSDLQNGLRIAWKEPDYRTRIYRVFWILSGLNHIDNRLLLGNRTEAGTFSVPAQGPFEKALFQLMQAGDLAKFCPNPECAAPYFFAARRSQKYCSDVCAIPAQREAKLRYWNTKGRKARDDQTKKKGGGR